jgi:hypothetical protein
VALPPGELQNITPLKTGKSKAFTAILHFNFCLLISFAIRYSLFVISNPLGHSTTRNHTFQPTFISRVTLHASRATTHALLATTHPSLITPLTHSHTHTLSLYCLSALARATTSDSIYTFLSIPTYPKQPPVLPTQN